MCDAKLSTDIPFWHDKQPAGPAFVRGYNWGCKARFRHRWRICRASAATLKTLLLSSSSLNAEAALKLFVLTKRVASQFMTSQGTKLGRNTTGFSVSYDVPAEASRRTVRLLSSAAASCQGTELPLQTPRLVSNQVSKQPCWAKLSHFLPWLLSGRDFIVSIPLMAS